MHFDGLQLEDLLARRSRMPRQFNLVSPPHSPPLNALVNAPPPLNQRQANVNVFAPPLPFLNPIADELFFISPGFHFALAPSPPALPLSVNYLVATAAINYRHLRPRRTFFSRKCLCATLIHRPHSRRICPLLSSPQPIYLFLLRIQTSGAFRHKSQLMQSQSLVYMYKIRQRITGPVIQLLRPYITSLLHSCTGNIKLPDSRNIRHHATEIF